MGAPPPMPDKFDWVQLKSGEWLKGEIKVLYEESLEFDSEELELLKLDFADIKQIRSAQVLNIRMRDGRTATGQVLMEDGTIRVLGDAPQQRVLPALDRNAADEEGRPCAARGEQVENLFRPQRRAVVERERDERRAGLVA